MHIVGLFEIDTTTTCTQENTRTFPLSLALAAEYVLYLANTTDSNLLVPGLKYGKYYEVDSLLK